MRTHRAKTSQSTRKERAGQKKLQRSAEFPSSLQISFDQYMHVRKLQGEEKILESSKWNKPRAHARPRIMKTRNIWGSGDSLPQPNVAQSH